MRRLVSLIAVLLLVGGIVAGCGDGGGEAELTPEQQQQLEEFGQEMEQMEQEGGPGADGPGGPGGQESE